MSQYKKNPIPSGFGRHARIPVKKPKNMLSTLKRLWQYVNRERKQLATIFLLTMGSSALTLSVPFLIGESIDAIAPSDRGVDFDLLEITVMLLFVAFVVDAMMTFLQGWLMAAVSQRIVKQLRGSLFEKLQRLPIGFFDQRTHGELMSRLTNDVDNVSQSISHSMTQFMSGLLVIWGSFVMMLVLSPWLTLASLITVPLMFILTRTITQRTQMLFKRQQAELGALNGHIEETITGIQVVKAFNQEQKVVQDFHAINDRLKDVGLKAQIWSGFLMPIMNVISNLGFAVIALAGGMLAVKGLITVGVIASFLSYSRQFVRPLNDMANLYNVLLAGVAGAERVFEILDEEEETKDKPNAMDLVNLKGDVVFDQVSFGYRSDVPILKNVSFEAKSGNSVALVGQTGAGKTTIVNLLTRFYDVTEGSIWIDGQDIREYSRDSLRRSFGFVLQDNYLFSGTIRENIKYGKPHASDGEVQKAAMLANADGFIRRLPHQYDTLLSENGGNLSQGQKQLLAIARVLLAQPSILILDEATSSIDTRTELQIQDALLEVMKGRTSFIIAHRLNTIRHADMILVINDGEIVEKGTHDELIEQQGFYYEMFSNQFKEGVAIKKPLV